MPDVTPTRVGAAQRSRRSITWSPVNPTANRAIAVLGVDCGISSTQVRFRHTSTTDAPPPAMQRSLVVHAVQSGHWPDSEHPDAPGAQTPSMAKNAWLTSFRPVGQPGFDRVIFGVRLNVPDLDVAPSLAVQS